MSLARSRSSSWISGAVTTRNVPAVDRFGDEFADASRNTIGCGAPGGDVASPYTVICSRMFVATPDGHRQVTPTPFGAEVERERLGDADHRVLGGDVGQAIEPVGEEARRGRRVDDVTAALRDEHGEEDEVAAGDADRLRSMTRCHASIGSASGAPMASTPTLLTTKSIRPNRSSAGREGVRGRPDRRRRRAAPNASARPRAPIARRLSARRAVEVAGGDGRPRAVRKRARSRGRCRCPRR